VRVLLVDDDPAICDSMRLLLELDGHDVATEEHAPAAIDAFQAAAAGGAGFEIVITDLAMPVLDGYRVAAAIRAIAPATPIILLTGWGQQVSAEPALRSLVSETLGKPARLTELRAAMERYRYKSQT